MIKVLLAIYLTVLSLTASADPSTSLESKVAVIDAGKYIAPTDTSIPRAKNLIEGLGKCYGVPPQKAADMSVHAWQGAKNGGRQLSLLDIMDAALIACDGKSNPSALADSLAAYIAVRSVTGQTHQQAVHGLLVLNTVAKKATK